MKKGATPMTSWETPVFAPRKEASNSMMIFSGEVWENPWKIE
jgi:hypothetical protein